MARALRTAQTEAARQPLRQRAAKGKLSMTNIADSCKYGKHIGLWLASPRRSH